MAKVKTGFLCVGPKGGTYWFNAAKADQHDAMVAAARGAGFPVGSAADGWTNRFGTVDEADPDQAFVPEEAAK